MSDTSALEVSETAEKLAKLTSTLLERVKLAQSQASPDGSLTNEPGLAFLTTKLELLLSYCIDVTFITLLKVEGQTIEGHPVIDQILLLQGVLERVRPLDAKMKHQLNKLIQLVTSGSSDAGLRPRLANLVPVGREEVRDRSATKIVGLGHADKEEEEEEQETDYTGNSGQGEIYQAPKLAAVPFEDDKNARSAEAKEQRRQDRLQQRMRASETLQSVRSEVLGTPEEVAGGTAGVASLGQDALSRVRREDAERTDWEEEHMMRRQVTKKDRASRKRLLAQANRLETIADVGDLAEVWGPARREGGSGGAGDEAGGFGDDDNAGSGGWAGGGAKKRKNRKR
jgi:hypothetical protein